MALRGFPFGWDAWVAGVDEGALDGPRASSTWPATFCSSCKHCHLITVESQKFVIYQLFVFPITRELTSKLCREDF